MRQPVDVHARGPCFCSEDHDQDSLLPLIYITMESLSASRFSRYGMMPKHTLHSKVDDLAILLHEKDELMQGEAPCLGRGFIRLDYADLEYSIQFGRLKRPGCAKYPPCLFCSFAGSSKIRSNPRPPVVRNLFLRRRSALLNARTSKPSVRAKLWP